MKTALEFYVSSIEEYEQKFELGLISFEVLKTTKKYWFEKAKEKEKEQMIDFAYKCIEYKWLLPQDVFNAINQNK